MIVFTTNDFFLTDEVKTKLCTQEIYIKNLSVVITANIMKYSCAVFYMFTHIKNIY